MIEGTMNVLFRLFGKPSLSVMKHQIAKWQYHQGHKLSQDQQDALKARIANRIMIQRKLTMLRGRASVFQPPKVKPPLWPAKPKVGPSDHIKNVGFRLRNVDGVYQVKRVYRYKLRTRTIPYCGFLFTEWY